MWHVSAGRRPACACPAHQGKLILQPRSALPLSDRTVYELLQELFALGWEWRPPPPPGKRGELGCSTVAPVRVFYCGKAPHTEYLQCLLRLEDLAALGVTVVPHLQARTVYEKLLRGEPFCPPQQRPGLTADVEPGPQLGGLGVGRRRRQQRQGQERLQWQDPDPGDSDVDGNGADGVAVAEATDTEADVGAAAAAVEESAALPLEEALAEIIDEVLVEPAQPGEPEPGERREEDLAAVAADLGPQARPAPAPGPAAPAPAADAAELVRQRPGRGAPWGVFRLTWKPSGRWGAVQAACPFHRGTDTAPQCRKTLQVREEGDEALSTVVRRLKGWCLLAPTVDRKYLHLSLPPPLVCLTLPCRP